MTTKRMLLMTAACARAVAVAGSHVAKQRKSGNENLSRHLSGQLTEHLTEFLTG